MNRITFALGFFLTVLMSVGAQPFPQKDLPFRTGQKLLRLPCTGGLNNPQLSNADLNGDGIDDLYIFDRTGNVHLTFLRQNEEWVFAPAFADHFPEVQNWVLLRDFNYDGAADLFAYSDMPGVGGVAVFKGYYDNGHLAFRRFSTGTPGNLLYYPLPGGGQTQLFVSNIDYPAVDDIDCDGDLDILTFNAAGGFVEFFRNQSLELGYGLDSLIYELEDDCWGGIFESGITAEVELAPAPGLCASQLKEGGPVVIRHTGSTLLTYDSDADGLVELVLGDLSFSGLNFLHNAGTCSEAWIDSQSLQFPSDMPVDLPFFPAAFHLDLDGDGLRDLAASPNDVKDSKDLEVIWYYENTGTAEQPQFSFRSRSFLVEEMLDFGTGAFPAFFDYNADGLMDLVVGNAYRYDDEVQRPSGLVLFENTGTPASPRFELKDDDFLGLRRFNPESYRFAPVFADMDNDGDADVLVGEVRGAFFYAENTAAPGAPAVFGPWEYPYQGLNVGLSSTPAVGDLNLDGLPDLIAGERNGNINYFQNQGTPENPLFDPDPDQAPNSFFLGEVDTRVPGSVVGFSAPALVSAADRLLLLTGSDAGQLELYGDVEANFNAPYELLSSAWGEIEQGFRTAPALADLDDDGLYEMAVGNARGGLAFFETDLQTGTTVAVRPLRKSLDLKLTPNPVSSELTIWLKGNGLDRMVEIRLFNAGGQLVRQFTEKSSGAIVSMAELPAGIYFIQVLAAGKIGWRKVVKR